MYFAHFDFTINDLAAMNLYCYFNSISLYLPSSLLLSSSFSSSFTQISSLVLLLYSWTEIHLCFIVFKPNLCKRTQTHTT